MLLILGLPCVKGKRKIVDRKIEMQEDKRMRKERAMRKQTVGVYQEEEKRNLIFSAQNQADIVLKTWNSSIDGLDKRTVLENREQYGKNKVTYEKKKSFPLLLMEAFVNPFTAILFALAMSFLFGKKIEGISIP